MYCQVLRMHIGCNVEVQFVWVCLHLAKSNSFRNHWRVFLVFNNICDCLTVVSVNVTTILTAYIISPLRGKGVSSSNSSVLHLRASSMMHCGHRFKYRNFCLVVSSTEFCKVTLKVSPLPPPLVAVDAVSYILHAFCPGSRGYPPIT